MKMRKQFLIRVATLLCALHPLDLQASGGDSVAISADDEMKFSQTSLAAKVGQPLTIVLTNDGSVMAHNLVVLTPGTDVAAFEESAMKQANNGYLPMDEQIRKAIIHTRMLDGGDSDKITFTPAAVGTYEFICTYPGHLAAGMRGKIIVTP